MVRPPQDPWRNAPTSELQDQILPRWFVLTALISIAAAIIVAVAAFLVARSSEVPVTERRPPPAAEYTTGVGDVILGDSDPQPVDPPCPEVAGIRIAGEEADRMSLTRGLAALCDSDLEPEVQSLVEDFAAAEGIIRFASFSETGVDSTAALDEPLILLNVRFTATDPAWIAPLIVHDLVARDGDPALATAAFAARTAEAEVCSQLFDDARPSRGCQDAQAITDLDDPLGALRDAGYR